MIVIGDLKAKVRSDNAAFGYMIWKHGLGDHGHNGGPCHWWHIVQIQKLS